VLSEVDYFHNLNIFKQTMLKPEPSLCWTRDQSAPDLKCMTKFKTSKGQSLNNPLRIIVIKGLILRCFLICAHFKIECHFLHHKREKKR